MNAIKLSAARLRSGQSAPGMGTRKSGQRFVIVGANVQQYNGYAVMHFRSCVECYTCISATDLSGSISITTIRSFEDFFRVRGLTFLEKSFQAISKSEFFVRWPINERDCPYPCRVGRLVQIMLNTKKSESKAMIYLCL